MAIVEILLTGPLKKYPPHDDASQTIDKRDIIYVQIQLISLHLGTYLPLTLPKPEAAKLDTGSLHLEHPPTYTKPPFQPTTSYN